ncbi:conserved hypothetical protein [Verticillium alfalfae VaMs.102]|uniref:3'-5' exonuclease domain-containing protein n=1 Tax=Verticillium alfalfae (strain VaMs.102 / ATCC MYA-4576 / FGSC 10136) TaxID=526221 RepID=C9S9I3_VERA1|nr:conserved hypothetical protein [Verticillium alfalfae VaMs.102]EEY16046.1 conserved hypothetical protein [Verticillium alfalfae VaMs.102]
MTSSVRDLHISPRLVNTEEGMGSFVTSIPSTSTLYLSLAGHNLGQHGELALVIVLVYPQMHIALLDVPVLNGAVFTTPGRDGRTLRSVLEGGRNTKCFWDIRSNAEALWSLCGVGLDNVMDIQLLENVTRSGDRNYVQALDWCVQRDLAVEPEELRLGLRARRVVTRAGGSAAPFTERPMSPETVLYCVNRVFHLPALHALYDENAEPGWAAWVRWESLRRALRVRSPGYDPRSSVNMVSPWSDMGDGGSWTFGDHVDATQYHWKTEAGEDTVASLAATGDKLFNADECRQSGCQKIEAGRGQQCF